MKQTSNSRKINNSTKVSKKNKRKLLSFETQQRKFVNHLMHNTVSCTMASKRLRLPQKNLCRLKAKLSERGLLVVVKLAPCKHTGRMVQYLSTNPEIISKVNKEGGCHE